MSVEAILPMTSSSGTLMYFDAFFRQLLDCRFGELAVGLEQ